MPARSSSSPAQDGADGADSQKKTPASRTPGEPKSAREFVPETRSITKLREAAAVCEGCELFQRATQTVFGEGPPRARLMLVGETPGDQEDLAGRPFVGAAGRLLDEALAEVGIDRTEIYITNAVKHFKWTPSGKRRLHAKPSSREIKACHPWLEAEIASIAPELIVCLGATAAQALLGRDFRITRQRGELLTSAWGSQILATYHPSAVLRAPDEAARQAMRRDLVNDLKLAADWLGKSLLSDGSAAQPVPLEP
jgi:uracil-DNA glycosylase